LERSKRERTLEKSTVAQELGVALAAAEETAEEMAEGTAAILAIVRVVKLCRREALRAAVVALLSTISGVVHLRGVCARLDE
jgi:hypothetical protein